MFKRTAAAAALVVAALSAPAVAQGMVLDTLLRADLHGDGVMHGHVRWIERHSTEAAHALLLVRVMDAEPNEDLDVFFNGEYVTTAVADADGRAIVHLRNPVGIDAPEVLDTVEVGPLTGVFFNRHPARPFDATQRYVLRTRAHGENVTAVVRYVERLKRNNIVQTFTVEVGGPYTEDLVVRINGEPVAVIVAPSKPQGSDVVSDTAGGRRTAPPHDGGGDDGGDDNGGLLIGENGRLILRTHHAAGANAEILPSWFPTLLPGDEIAVGPATGELYQVYPNATTD